MISTRTVRTRPLEDTVSRVIGSTAPELGDGQARPELPDNDRKARDKNVVIADGVRYTKADADDLGVKPDVANKARSTT